VFKSFFDWLMLGFILDINLFFEELRAKVYVAGKLFWLFDLTFSLSINYLADDFFYCLIFLSYFSVFL